MFFSPVRCKASSDRAAKLQQRAGSGGKNSKNALREVTAVLVPEEVVGGAHVGVGVSAAYAVPVALTSEENKG